MELYLDHIQSGKHTIQQWESVDEPIYIITWLTWAIHTSTEEKGPQCTHVKRLETSVDPAAFKKYYEHDSDNIS